MEKFDSCPEKMLSFRKSTLPRNCCIKSNCLYGINSKKQDLLNRWNDDACFRMAAGTRITARQRTQSNNHSNISDLLDNLLRGYDNSVRPDFGGPPATVEVDIMVRSMGPISEVDMVSHTFCSSRAACMRDKRCSRLDRPNQKIDQVIGDLSYIHIISYIRNWYVFAKFFNFFQSFTCHRATRNLTWNHHREDNFAEIFGNKNLPFFLDVG